MNKRRLHHVWTKLRFIKPWYFLILAAISVLVCVFALRANNENMIHLRDAVYAADQANTDVEAALKNLQVYVTTHMNTNLSTGSSGVYPPIQLKYTYDRFVQAQNTAALKGNDQLYSQAQAYCEGQNHTDFSGRNRVPCIEQYVQAHGGQTGQQLPTIPDALYKFSFISPRWSPDLAGWSMVVAVLSGLFFIATFVLNRWLRHYTA